MSPPASLVVVLSTFPADRDAAPLARALVDERLAACVNILPTMQSLYRWQGQVEQALECQLVVKTTAAQLHALKVRLAELHPYDVPELLVLPVSDAGSSYSAWIEASVGPAAR